MKYFLVFVVSNLKNILGKSAKIVLDGSPRQLDILQSMPGKNPFVFSDRNLFKDRHQMRSCSMQVGWEREGLPADFYTAPLLLRLCIFRFPRLAATLNYHLLLAPGVFALLDHVGDLAVPVPGPVVRPAKMTDQYRNPVKIPTILISSLSV